MSARKKFKVTRGNSIMWVSPWRGRWRFAWRKKPGDPWRYTVRSTKEEAEKAAALKMAELPTGGLSWSEISPARRHFLEAIHRDAGPADEDALLAFLASRRKSGGIAAAVARFIEDKTAAKGGHESPHLAQVRRDLEALATDFPGRVLMDITHPDLRAWWTARTGDAGAARKQALRTTLAMFWKWARKDGIAGNDVDTVADRLPRIEPGEASLSIFHLEELAFLLSTVEREWFPLIVLGAFQGLRPEEIAPKQGSRQPPKPGAPARKIAPPKARAAMGTHRLGVERDPDPQGRIEAPGTRHAIAPRHPRMA